MNARVLVLQPEHQKREPDCPAGPTVRSIRAHIEPLNGCARKARDLGVHTVFSPRSCSRLTRGGKRITEARLRTDDDRPEEARRRSLRDWENETAIAISRGVAQRLPIRVAQIVGGFN